MTEANYTGNEKQKSFQEPFCTAEVIGTVHNQLIFLSVLNIILTITAFLGNTLILVALHKESSLHPPSKVLFRSLAASDLCISIIAQPLEVIYLMSVVNEQWNICRYTFAAASLTFQMLCLVSLLTITAISVDRLLALLLGLRYRQIVTLKRTYASVIAFWVVSFVGCIMALLWSEVPSSWYNYIILTLCLVTIIYSYTRIFGRLRHHQTQVQDNVTGHFNRKIPINIARYRKTVSSALWLLLTLVFCYLPFTVVAPLAVREIHNRLSSRFFLATQFTVTLLYLNSSLNPVLYCWKIREVRRAVKDTIRQIFFWEGASWCIE